MGAVVFEITMSLDGFIAGPGDDLEHPLGVGGDRLHQWVYELSTWREIHGLEGGESNRDAELLEESFAGSGAIVLGRRMFDLARGWGDEPPFKKPVFVLTHESRAPLVKGETTFTFVNDGIESALEQARAAAGDKNVNIGGGAETGQQYLRAGLIDELEIHVAPVLLGAGRRLFDDDREEQIELEPIRMVESDAVTHLRYRVAGPTAR